MSECRERHRQKISQIQGEKGDRERSQTRAEKETGKEKGQAKRHNRDAEASSTAEGTKPGRNKYGKADHTNQSQKSKRYHLKSQVKRTKTESQPV